jgi:hypothetical protein
MTLLACRRVSSRAVVVLGVLLALAGCSDQAVPSASVPSASPPPPTVPLRPRYQDQRAGFALTPPAGFLQVSTADDSSVTGEFMLPGDGPNTVRANLTISAAPTAVDLPTLIASSRRLLRIGFPDYQSTVDEPITLPGGEQGWLLGGGYTLRGVRAHNLQLFLLAHHTSYVFTGLTTETVFHEFDPAFREAFNSVTVQ